MRTPSEHTIEANGLRLHYLEWGKAPSPTLLLIHGGSAHAHWWDFFAAAVADRYRVVCPDLRGHGDSGQPEPARYEIEDYVADVAAVVEATGARRLAVVGHSMGGAVAAAYAHRAGDAVEALVLVDMRVRTGAGSRRYLERLAQVPHPVYSSRAEGVRRFRLLPSAHGASRPVLEHVAAHGLRDLAGGRSTPKFARAALAAAALRDVSAELGALSCPLLFVRGAHSTAAPPAAAAEVCAVAPQARVVEIPDAHHHVMLDNPQAFERAVAGFLDAALG